ncbi:MAG: xylanase/chitin deacetylase [Paenibacillaceae bacterium]|jgi:peptidoglycan-N-acetylmuramic acid deacetylase|nr:xylanase/chitin deacetylase [Paenibacillaceae bacterium]
MKKKDGQVPGFPGEVKQLAANQKAVWVGSGKKVYLTFDTGGPIGESDKLLSILKDNEVKVTFFLVGYNVKQYKDFAKKVSEEGHLIGNHTMTHKDMTKLSDEEVKQELEDFASLIKEVTGKPPAPLFRFPYGAYSMHLLDMVSEMGYTSVFWSTAMRDWEPRAGGAEDPYNDIMNGLHEGNIILMHQGSQENIEALDRIIKDVKKAGYEFASLEELVK